MTNHLDLLAQVYAAEDAFDRLPAHLQDDIRDAITADARGRGALTAGSATTPGTP
jgi:hypothetical protein